MTISIAEESFAGVLDDKKHDSTSHTLLLKVKDNSMMGDNIFEGDRVLVIATCDYSPSDICVVAVDGREATLKRVISHADVCELTPSNASMESKVYPAENVHVLGVVVEVRHRIAKTIERMNLICD